MSLEPNMNTRPTVADSNALPTFNLDAIRATAQRLAPYVLRTPVVPLHGLWSNRLLNDGPASVMLKLELFQHTGSFKARGALNTVMGLTAAQKEKGITAASAGNHAIAAAFAASTVSISAKIAVTATASPVRLALARAYGSELLIAPDPASAFSIAERLMREEGRAMVHPFDGESTCLGTAGVGLELCAQMPDVEAIIVAVGGGGLISGIAAAVKQLQPQCEVWGVEPEGADAMRQSFASGQPTQLEGVNTIADSLGAPMTLPYSLGLCRRYVDGIVTVTDDAICQAMAIQFYDAKLAVEPAAAAALAALLGPLRERLRGRRVALVICGANIDAQAFTRHLLRGTELLESSSGSFPQALSPK